MESGHSKTLRTGLKTNQYLSLQLSTLPLSDIANDTTKSHTDIKQTHTEVR